MYDDLYITHREVLQNTILPCLDDKDLRVIRPNYDDTDVLFLQYAEHELEKRQWEEEQFLLEATKKNNLGASVAMEEDSSRYYDSNSRYDSRRKMYNRKRFYLLYSATTSAITHYWLQKLTTKPRCSKSFQKNKKTHESKMMKRAKKRSSLVII